MKSITPKSPFLLLIVCALFFSACQDEITSTYTYRTMYPVYLEMSDVRARVYSTVEAQPLESPGKIYIYGDYLLVNEPTKGIHILDNSNPKNPVNLSFIPIPGSMDLAVNNGFLYADNYVDLLVFNIQNPSNIQLVERVEDVFPQLYGHETGQIITFKDTVITSEDPYYGGWGCPNCMAFNDALSFSSNYSAASQSYGTGGSMARFTLMNGHLYTIDDNSLRVFDVRKAQEPNYLKEMEVGWGIETIFPYQSKLFLGSNRGMYIYDASTPSTPELLSVFEHILSCDPVVVNEKFAFVTLRNGNVCWNGSNELQVINIENPSTPYLMKSYEMLNPHGLGLAGDYLYVTEGEHGLKSFNVSDVLKIDENQLEFLTNQKSVDLIPGPKSLIVIGPDGICQYDYSQPDALEKLSCIQVEQPIAF